MKQILMILSSAFIFITCTADDSYHEPASFSAGDPELHGFYPDSLENVTRFLEEAVDKQWIPGAVALIVRDGSIVYEEPVGYSDMEQEIPMQTDYIFRLASMTKAVTSVSVLMLYDRKLLDLDDPVSLYIPEFSNPQVVETVDFTDSTWSVRPAIREVTIHDLLTHTSGIAYGFADSTMNVIYQKADVPDGVAVNDRTIEEAISILGSLPLKHDPGEQWTYGLNTDVLGRVVEVVSGKTLHDFFQSEIFEPLGMGDTMFFLPEEKTDRLVPLYHNPEANSLERLRQVSVGDSEPVSPDEVYIGDGRYFSGGAGLAGTALDYKRFMQMILNQGQMGEVRLLNRNTVDLLFENQIGDLRFGNDGFSYGFQVTLEDGNLNSGREPGRVGWGGIFQTTYWMQPSKNISVLLMTQVFPSMHRQELYNGFEERVNGSVMEVMDD